MTRIQSFIHATGSIVVAAWLSAAALAGGRFEVPWHTIDGGGAMFSEGGGFTLGGTIGQPDAGGPMTGGDFSVVGGFWVVSVDVSTCPADLNGDGMIDGADLGMLLLAWDTADPEADLTNDGNVDGADLGILLLAWGPCA